ncbi:hypothetical protein ACJMK2_026321 [Sinanodonta woodiana]|uniref:Ig-like domain-containing protein n=1 Tax=Sinanodonta woodiana TaxID=1069815 RepID=A0ABD3XJ93_SINWO
MTSFNIVKVFMFFNFLTHFTVCNTDPLLGFTGCNATLQWNMSNNKYKHERTMFRIIDNAGDVIATKENNQCISKNNLFMSCILSHKNDAWIMALTLMNITSNHTGNYTAWFKVDESPHSETKTMPLIIIDKPQIMEVRKPLVNQNFSVMCITSYTSDCITYYWKINGSKLQDSINLYATMSTLTYRNVTMMDNFSRLTCQARIENCSNVLCNSYEDSDPYTIEPYYGPMYVSLTHNESHIYLEENTTLKVKCSANCYPACTFQWVGNYINVDNEELLINNFNERYSGPYTCTAKNRETGVTAKSSLLLLHLEKGQRELLRWIGPVFFVAAFVIFATVWKLKASREIEKRSKLQARAEHEDNELSRTNTGTNSRALPRILKRFARTKTNRMINKEYHETGTNSQPLHLLQTSNDRSKLQEDPYNTIDENVLTVYNYSTYNVIGETSQEAERGPEHRMYYYGSSSCYHVEAADVHATDETYLNPVSGFSPTSESHQFNETYMNVTDKEYITVIDDCSRPVEETGVTEADPTYITPIAGSQ